MNNDISSFGNIKIEVKVRIGSKKISLKELLKLKEGSKIELDKNEFDYVDLMTGDEIIAKGVIVEKDEHYAIQIKEIKNQGE